MASCCSPAGKAGKGMAPPVSIIPERGLYKGSLAMEITPIQEYRGSDIMRPSLYASASGASLYRGYTALRQSYQ